MTVRPGECHPHRVVLRRAPAVVLAALLVASGPGVQGCGRRQPRAPQGAIALPVTVASDSGTQATLRVPPASEARAWLTGVTRDRLPPARIGRAPAREVEALESPLPEPGADSLPPGTGGEHRLAGEDRDLLPPIPRGTTPLKAPPGRCRGPDCSVELDVRVDEEGAVSDVVWAGGSERAELVEAATECARGMRFYPALLDGRPVAVWCRQQFDFATR